MDIHIGQHIEEKVRESGISITEFARKINTVPKNVYNIFSRDHIKTDQLTLISEVLHYNFFKLYNSDTNVVSEPIESYGKPTDKLHLFVELDGTQNTLQLWLKRLTKINQALV